MCGYSYACFKGKNIGRVANLEISVTTTQRHHALLFVSHSFVGRGGFETPKFQKDAVLTLINGAVINAVVAKWVKAPFL